MAFVKWSLAGDCPKQTEQTPQPSKPSQLASRALRGFIVRLCLREDIVPCLAALPLRFKEIPARRSLTLRHNAINLLRVNVHAGLGPDDATGAQHFFPPPAS